MDVHFQWLWPFKVVVVWSIHNCCNGQLCKRHDCKEICYQHGKYGAFSHLLFFHFHVFLFHHSFATPLRCCEVPSRKMKDPLACICMKLPHSYVIVLHVQFLLFSSSSFPSLHSGRSTYLQDFGICDHQIVIQVVRFWLQVWCILCVFLLQALSCVGHEHQDSWRLCDGVNEHLDWALFSWGLLPLQRSRDMLRTCHLGWSPIPGVNVVSIA